MTGCTCPTCGSPIVADHFSFDVDSGVVVARGQFVNLPRREADILMFLLERRGKTVRKGAIFQALYTFDEATENENVVESHVSKLRKKIEPLGLIINSERFKGYTLTMGASS